MKGINVLIVEDNKTFRQSLKGVLEKGFSGLNIHEASDALEACNIFKSVIPDIIFMDIKLPGMNGLELTKKIHSEHPDLPIFVLTSYDLPEYREAAYKCGARHFLTKGNAREVDVVRFVSGVLAAFEKK